MYNLLVVDDESMIRRGIKALIDFRSIGIAECMEAESGEAALKIMEENTIHLMLADINMPKMNGLDLAIAAKKYDPDIRIALITGYDYLDYAIRAVKIGVDDYILKPVSKEDVRKALISLMEKRKAGEKLSVIRSAVNQITQDAKADEEGSLKGLIIEEMEKNISRPSFTLNQMAADLGYSVSYLSAIFKKQFGYNFRDYFFEMKMERAKILLLSTQMKNYEIAAAVGIEDPNYFSACFKRKYHMTPKEFKRRAGAGYAED